MIPANTPQNAPRGRYNLKISNQNRRQDRKSFLIRTSQMLYVLGLPLGGHSDLGSKTSPHSCGTAPDSHRTFPVTSNDCSPLEPNCLWS